MMENIYNIKYIPLRTLSVLFVLFTNSDYATFGTDAGFFCDDESIKQPYYGDSIRATYLFVVLLGIFGLIVYASELIYKNCEKGQFQCRLLLKYYYSGYLYVLAITEVLKICHTKLRPHFFYTCLPDMSNIDCSKGLITEFNCTGEGSQWLINRDIYKSFPSGHSALSVYAFVFISIYLYSRKSYSSSTRISGWWTRLITAVCFLWTVACCYSRVLDNRHFWLDVLTGAFLGIIGGIITVNMALHKAIQKIKFSK